jgi:hypothetical protein
MKPEDIENHLDLWKMFYYIARGRYRGRCHADWEDAASYSYTLFIKEFGRNRQDWRPERVNRFGALRTIDFFKRRLADVPVEEPEGREVQAFQTSEKRKEAACKCLSEIGELMDRLTPRGVKKKILYSDFLDGFADGPIRRLGNGFQRPSKHPKLVRNAVYDRYDRIQSSEEAAMVWNKYKEEAYS